jgi:hypothetical protein
MTSPPSMSSLRRSSTWSACLTLPIKCFGDDELVGKVVIQIDAAHLDHEARILQLQSVRSQCHEKTTVPARPLGGRKGASLGVRKGASSDR